VNGITRVLALLLGLVAAACLVPAGASAHTVGELEERARALTPSRVGPPLATQRREEPEGAATPQRSCEPGSRTEPGIQGRVPADADRDGYLCNLQRVSQFGSAGGFKVRRYVDKAGNECAYYDTALLFPLNLLNLQRESAGVAVLDMKDPAKPVLTSTLVTPAMLSPHESLVLSEERGLLAAVAGNPAFAPGIVDLYDISQDCRFPVLQSSLPVGFLGHESGFTPDGKTFYSASPATGTVVAIGVDNPRLPQVLWFGNYPSHGLSLSDDGNRAYIASLEGLIILDVSEVQARKASPVVKEVSRLTWSQMTIPQNAIPVTIKGKPYLVETDEYSGGGGSAVGANGPVVGAARLIDISDETKPRVASNLRLAVHQPENRAAIAQDPGAQSPVQGYAGHYCDVPTRVDPTIVACSMIVSGLRVFDIRDPEKPVEVAYHVAPPQASAENLTQASNFAMSAPAFAPERREVWYSDGVSGFYNLKLSEGAWPAPAAPAPPACRPATGLRAVGATAAPAGGLRLAIDRRSRLPVRVDVFAVSAGTRVLEERLVARFPGRTGSFTWTGRSTLRDRRAVPAATYLVRFTMLRDGRPVDVRRVVVRRGADGRFVRRPDSHRRDGCGLIGRFKLQRPVFGGPAQIPLRASYRTTQDAKVTVTVLRGRTVVARFGTADVKAGRTVRMSLAAKGRRRADYTVRVVAVPATGRRATATLVARRL
jgi:hypothetical protein